MALRKLQKLLGLARLCFGGKVGHCFPEAVGFIGFTDGDRQGINPEIFLEPVGCRFCRRKGAGREG